MSSETRNTDAGQRAIPEDLMSKLRALRKIGTPEEDIPGPLQKVVQRTPEEKAQTEADKATGAEVVTALVLKAEVGDTRHKIDDDLSKSA